MLTSRYIVVQKKEAVVRIIARRRRRSLSLVRSSRRFLEEEENENRLNLPGLHRRCRYSRYMIEVAFAEKNPGIQNQQNGFIYS